MSHPTWATHADADPSATIRPEREPVDEASPFDRGPVDLAFTETLGEGAMGVVRLAAQPKLDRIVAVKSLKRPDPHRVNRLLREARVTGALQHPNIVPVYDILVDRAHQPHILMKRISGVEWERVIEDADAVRERFGTSDLLGWNLGILNTLCNALNCAHAEGVIHRDLKPSNVMIGEFGEVYLVDWGIACAVEDASRGIAGTPRYMSPEMARGEHAGVLSDVYLLGGLLHRILTGTAPHRGFSIEEILANIPRFDPAFPEGSAPVLVELVRRSMALAPTDRPPSVEVFRLEVMDFVERRGAMALSDRAYERLDALAQAVEEGDRRRMDQELAACRFGFHASLEAWPDNPRARHGLTAAVTQVARYALKERDAVAARALMESLPSTDAELEREVQHLEVEVEAERVQRLQLLRETDQRLGARTRMVLVGSFGSIWVLVLVWGQFNTVVVGHSTQIAVGLGTIFATIAFCVWARESLLATHMNRLTTGLMLTSPLAQFLMACLLGILDVDPRIDVALYSVLYATLLMAGAFAMDLRVLVSALGFVAAAFVGVLFPEFVLLSTAGGLVVFIANMLWIWWPSVQPQPGEGLA